jgi:hypothetical protein
MHFVFNTVFFFENRAVYEVMWKNAKVSNNFSIELDSNIRMIEISSSQKNPN